MDQSLSGASSMDGGGGNDKENHSEFVVQPQSTTIMGLTSRHTTKMMMNNNNCNEHHEMDHYKDAIKRRITPTNPTSSSSSHSPPDQQYPLSYYDNSQHGGQEAKCCETMKHDVGELVYRIPGSSRLISNINRLPKWMRISLLVLWLLWKVVMTIIFLRVAFHTAKFSHETLSKGNLHAVASASFNADFEDSTPILKTDGEERLLQDPSTGDTTNNNNYDVVTEDDNVFAIGANDKAISQERPFKILYIVTALAEYNSGTRGTTRGEDRLQNMFIPLLVEGVTSIKQHNPNWIVDVYLVLGWELSDDRRQLIQDALPNGVQLEIWDDAIPLGYDKAKHPTIQPITRTLARQHRLVINDKLDEYDFFSVWEDDMRITSDHIQYFVKMSYDLEQMRLHAMEHEQQQGHSRPQGKRDELFFGDELSSSQIKNMIPGFFRVEVMPSVEDAETNTEPTVEPVPIDFVFDDISLNQNDHDNKNKATTSFSSMLKGTLSNKNEYHVDPKPCCYMMTATAHTFSNNNENSVFHKVPTTPKAEQLMTWETNIRGFSVREFPTSGKWMAFQLGPKDLSNDQYTHSFWSGDAGYFGSNQKRETGANPQLFGQQGGYMLHKSHILRLEQDLCPGRYLPPFNEPYFKDNGLFMNNVEFYSGGYQLFSNNRAQAGCNLQRVIDLHPTNFSHHLLYHTSNNKQRTITINRRVKVDNLFGQLNTIRKDAMKKKQELLSQQQSSTTT